MTMDNLRRRLINLGCGPHVSKTSWDDYDGSWNVLASRLPMGLGLLSRKLLGHKGDGYPQHVQYLNVKRALPFADRSVDAVYFSHLLEHLHLDEGRRLLIECHRVLRAGGVIRIVVPDTEHFLDSYRGDRASGSDACLNLNRNLSYRPLVGKTGLLRSLYTAATDFHSHKFMYDRPFLSECLRVAGFEAISEANYGHSRIAEIEQVELRERLNPGLGFGFEAVRP